MDAPEIFQRTQTSLEPGRDIQAIKRCTLDFRIVHYQRNLSESPGEVIGFYLCTPRLKLFWIAVDHLNLKVLLLVV